MFDAIYDFLDRFYRKNERPALEAQTALFRKNTFMADLKILDATPVYRNTLNKYLPLLGAGADLTVGYGKGVPFDAGIVRQLHKFGIKTVENGTAVGEFDVILDCAGANCDVKVKYGVSELTRSGFYHYEARQKKVFLADSSHIKSIETALGTGDGFIRAMTQLGYDRLKDKKIVIFGCGKVGSGIAMYCCESGAQVYGVDDWKGRKVPHRIRAVDRFDRKAVEAAVKGAFCIVSVTGIYGALSDAFDIKQLVNSDTLIANMGVEDEFGGMVDPKRILNDNQPLNFILSEPTHLKFIDPAMALHNYGIEALVNSRNDEKFIIPDQGANDFYLNIVRRDGIINKELDMLEKYIRQEQ